MGMETNALNAAYPSGPPMPPQKSYHRPGRGGGDCCCGCLGCLCDCVFGLIFKLICTAVVILGLVILALWLVFRPNKVTFRAVDASLTRFELGPNGTLRYDLALNLTVRNPNRRVGVYYDSIEARSFYEGQRFAFVFLPTFYQGHKNTTELSARFEGQNLVMLQEVSKGFDSEKGKGVFGIEVKLYLRTRLRVFWGIKTPKFKPKIECDLKVPLTNANGTTAVAGAAPFEPTKCDVDF